jgi:MtN3 and saliva related transmembrane protein
MNWVAIMGLVAGMLTIISFLPQAIKTIKTKSTKDISLGIYIVLMAGTGLWILCEGSF